MTGRKNCALIPYNALQKFSKALYGATGGTCSARFFRPLMMQIVVWCDPPPNPNP